MRNKIRKFIKKNKALSKFLLGKFIKLHNYSYHKISEYSAYLNDDIHPKHSIINYHKFFVDKVDAHDTILDIGCGNGFLSYEVAGKAKEVVGIDIKDYNIREAQKRFSRANLKYIIGDATKYDFGHRFDKIILSNVLEHIENRVEFLSSLKKVSDVIILRVPMINREWLAVYKKQMGFEYRLDSTHFIEYTVEDLEKELKKSGWYLDYYQVNWGELWAVLKVKHE
ncbi:class I SAM-dependent methyltransferase [Candidatus Parcubacteria bacterium]|nr:MAG: class I SAM-dependent methyltransferase [Candidatus Parcubacteria bacterium]